MWVWDVQSKLPVATLTGHKGSLDDWDSFSNFDFSLLFVVACVMGVDSHPSEKVLISCSADPERSLRIWRYQ